MAVDAFALSPSSIPWSNVTGFCPDTLPYRAAWIVPLGQCVTNVRLYLAFFIGLGSILCWMTAQVPQLVLNCIHGKADEALSFWFLLQWFAGDSTNLVGALLTHQLTTQVVTAIYFVFIDVVMMTQYVFYQIRNHGRKGLIDCFKCHIEATATMILFPCLLLTVVFTSTHSITLWTAASSPTHNGGTGRTLLSNDTSIPVVDITDPKDVIGYVFGCVSATLYICSRMPQIMKNFIRQSTDGLSLPMFVLAVLGNITYSLGILLVSVEPTFILRKLPWLIGSIGTFCLDFTIFLQFLVFGSCHRNLLTWYATKMKDTCRNDESTPLIASTTLGVRSSTSIWHMCICTACKHCADQPSNGHIQSTSYMSHDIITAS